MANTSANKGIGKINFEQWSTRLGVMGGLIAILSFIPQVREFFGWTKSLQYVELGASFPNEKWQVAQKKDFAWLEGEWSITRLPGFISVFKIENEKLYRRNKSSGSYKEDNFETEWVPAKVHISTDGLLRLQYDEKSKWYLNFIRKEDDCMCYESERYTADDGTLRSDRPRQMMNVARTKLSAGGITYSCE